MYGGARETRRRTLATVLGEIAEERSHGVVLRGIDHRTAFAPDCYQACQAQPIEMKRKRIWREPEFFRDLTRRQTIRSHLDEQPVDIKAIILRKRSQRGDGV